MASRELGVLGLLDSQRPDTQMALVRTVSRAALLVFVGYQIGYAAGSAPSEAEVMYERVRQSIERASIGSTRYGEYSLHQHSSQLQQRTDDSGH